MSKLFLIVSLFLLSCVPASKCPVHSEVNTFNIFISNSFTVLQKKLITDAINEWSRATNPVFVFNIKYTNVSNEVLQVYPFNQENSYNTIFIMLAPASWAPSNESAGYFTARYGTNYIGMIDRDIELVNEKLYTNVVIHEIGHVLGLEHLDIDHKTIMTSFGNKSSGCITKIDLKYLCKVWCCDYTKLHPCTIS